MSKEKMGTPNRLVHEKSPYLQQHAYNPVDWFPWGEEAFAKARDEEKPIFLSIGYSTCHWCHVMEHESFEDEAIAKILREHFVAIKVDREERPDIDHIYMTAVQAMTGSGGWPMTVFLAPDLKPFFGGTYFPPKAAYGRPSFSQLLLRVAELWRTERAALLESGEMLSKAIADTEASGADSEIANPREVIGDALQYLRRNFDKAEGGFGGAPKFPRPVNLDLLFHDFGVTGNVESRDMALFTLRKMADGGMHDHLGGGFHRYSVDKLWRVSHFEKMLYDQAQLVHSYLDAFQITQDVFFADVAHDVCNYVLRDMTHAEGGFFSAEDADSEGVEGTFYVWEEDELRNALGTENAKIIAYLYGITTSGNFEHGKNVLYVNHSIEDAATEFGLSEDKMREIVNASKAALFAIRERRPRPHLDDKIQTSWNGMMIGALARTGVVLDHPQYTTAAVHAASFLKRNLVNGVGELLHRWRDGESRYTAYLDDYAFLIAGLIELYQSTFDVQWLDWAVKLQVSQNQALWDDTLGGYFMSEVSSDQLLRMKNGYDGAEPSGNSISVLNLLKLTELTEAAEHSAQADRTIQYFLPRIAKHPYAMPELLVGISRRNSSSTQIILTGPLTNETLVAMQRVIASHYAPSQLVMAGELDVVRERAPEGDKVAAFVCHDFICELPVTSAEALDTLLTKVN
ncbi:MAG: thioredoxin domain-containing protein [Candidatus Kapaibacterium sp.]